MASSDAASSSDALPTWHEAMVRSLKRTREMYLSNYGQRPEIHHERCALARRRQWR